MTSLCNDYDETSEDIQTPKWLRATDFDDLIVVFPEHLGTDEVKALLPEVFSELKGWLDKGNCVTENNETQKVLGHARTYWQRNQYKFWEPCQHVYTSEELAELSQETVDNMIKAWQRREAFGNDWWLVFLEIKHNKTGITNGSWLLESDTDQASIKEALKEALRVLIGGVIDD